MNDEVRVKVRGRWITLRKHDIGPKEPNDLLPRRYRIPRDLEMPSVAKALGFGSVDLPKIRR